MRNSVILTIPGTIWERTDVRDACLRRDVGTLFRLLRKHTGASQRMIAEVTGLSQPDVSAIERGRRHVSTVEVTDRIFHGLHVPDDLCPTPVPNASAASTSATGSASATTLYGDRDPVLEDDVRRRNLLAGAVGLGAGLVAANAAPATAETTSLEDVLLRPREANPVALDRLDAEIALGSGDFRAARYSTLAARLPALIAAAEATRSAATSTGRRAQANAAVSRAYILGADLAHKRHDDDVAWAICDRALTAARASSNPAVLGEAARKVAVTLRRSGRATAGIGLLAQTAGSLDVRGRPAPEVLGVYGALHLTAAYCAAVGGQRQTADDFLAEAAETASRLPHGRTLPTEFSAAQVAVYGIGVHTALGDGAAAQGCARRVVPSHLPSDERRARYWTDVARMWWAEEDPVRAFGALRGVEAAAPQEARRPAVRALTADLLYAPGHVPGLREFAARTGARAT